MPTVRDREVTIELPGVPARQHSFAKREIGGLLDGVAAAAEADGTPFLVRRICVTDRFEDEVRRVLEEQSGDTGYEAVREHVRAFGKTVWTRSQRGDLEFAVIVDAGQVGSWEPNNPRWFTTVIHELFHVLLNGRHLLSRGEENYTAVATTREQLLHRWATRLLDEFAVDRLVDHLARSLVRRDDGDPWSLRELEEAQGVDWVQALLDGLNQMPEALDDNIWRYRTSRMTIDELAVAVIPKVNDLLTLLAHTASIYMDTERWSDIVKDIRETKTARRFLGQHLDSILGALDNPELPFDESLQIVERAVEGVFRNCGLGFQTVPEGVYISVDAPSP